jgi:hypothetical protein
MTEKIARLRQRFAFAPSAGAEVAGHGGAAAGTTAAPAGEPRMLKAGDERGRPARVRGRLPVAPGRRNEAALRSARPPRHGAHPASPGATHGMRNQAGDDRGRPAHLRGCLALASHAPMETAAPAVAARPAAPAASPEPRECVIKPVMTEEDLRACSARR